MDNKFIQIVYRAVKETFKSLCDNNEIHIEYPVLSGSSAGNGKVASVISFKGYIKGAIILKSSEKGAAFIASRIGGPDIDESPDVTQSGNRECLNIIMGMVKRYCDLDNKKISFSLPEKVLDMNNINDPEEKEGPHVYIIYATFDGYKSSIELHLS